MSQKAWMQAYTKGSKSLQARLAKIHANNPEFQDFVKKHGFGGNLSKKQSEMQKTSSVGTVKPVTEPHPERSNLDREAMIKAAAEKIKNRRQAHANRVAFGGELGGGFALHNVGFRTYREDVNYKDGILRMHKGGWIALRNNKQLGTVMPTDVHAKELLDATRETLAHKVMKALSLKKKNVARARFATESAANRRRIRSWDSAIMPELRPLRVKPKSKVPFDEDPPKKNPGIVVGKNDPGYSRARHLARLGLKKAMEKSQ